jgi:hypothetical protein
MVTIMDMNSDEIIVVPQEYGEEVLNANWLPPRPEPALQLLEVEHSAKSVQIPPTDIDSFLRAVYRYQQ